jgi:hypothetical protein
MDYLLLSDYMWYFGHILTGCSAIFTRDNYFLSVSLVVFGQCITIISRPIGRIKNNYIEEPVKEDENI